MSHYERLLAFYQAGPVPWDQPDPPPEVLATVATLPVGRALDLGCGLGRATLFMAGRGWEVDGVDFVAQAVAEAQARAEQTALAAQAHFHVGSVLELDFLDGPYDFALDVGCAHNLGLDELRAYHRGLVRLLGPDALYLLFAHLGEDTETPDARRWLAEADLRQVFADGFILEQAAYGTTKVGDQAPWRSAWFWFRRTL